MSLIRRKPRVMPDSALEEIAAFEKWLVDANTQRMRDDGYDAETLARESANVKTLAANVAERMRADYWLSQKPKP
jgi:hypothetical protein